MYREPESRLRTALRALLLAADEETRAGWVFPSNLLRTWTNLGFGLPAFMLSLIICWAACAVVALTVLGWGWTVFDLWAGGIRPASPDCYLRTEFWDLTCVVISIIVALRTGNHVRRWIMGIEPITWPQLRIRLLPRLAPITVAIILMSGGTYLWVRTFNDLPAGFLRSCVFGTVQGGF